MNKIYGGLVSQPRNSRGTTIIGTGITHTFSGEVTETIVIPEEYVVHDVIAPEGDVQVFKDHTCTIYADGTEKVVYARLNTAVGFGEGWYVGGGAFANTFCLITTPSEESPSDSYSINIWMDWDSDDFSEAFTEGLVVKCTNQSPTFEPVENPTTVFSKPPTPVGPTAIDLGLPSGTLWADRNVGASSETDYGNYYMYGMGSKTYESTDTPYAGTENPLAASADTAVQVWGGSWHMPTRTQMQELTANTTYQWVTNYKGSGINGGTFTATNGAVLFIPAAGYWYDGSQYIVGSGGGYWGSAPDGSSNAYSLLFSDGDEDVTGSYRGNGYSVRPVQNTSV